MKNLSNLLSLIQVSKLTLIGYSTRYKSMKDEILSHIPYFDVTNSHSLSSLDAFIREDRIDQIIYNSSPINKSLLVDMAGTIPGDRKKMQDNLTELRQTCPYNIIVLSYINTSLSGGIDGMNSFMGGNSVLYSADFAFIISERISIIKNRHSNLTGELF